jgi:hypothetical protein
MSQEFHMNFYANWNVEETTHPGKPVQMATESKVIANVLYPRKNMSSFNMDYYLNHHIPATKASWLPLGMTSCIVCDVDDDAEFAVMVIITWRDVASWDAAKNGGAAQKLAEDVRNFTNVPPVTIVGKVLN